MMFFQSFYHNNYPIAHVRFLFCEKTFKLKKILGVLNKDNIVEAEMK